MRLPEWSRRGFLLSPVAASLLTSSRALRGAEAVPIPAKLRNPEPYEALRKYIAPGQDGFAGEVTATEIQATHDLAVRTRSITLAPAFLGQSPEPLQWTVVGPGVQDGIYGDSPVSFATGWQHWLKSL